MRKHLLLSVVVLQLATAAWAFEKTGKVVLVEPAANTFTIETEQGDRIVYRAGASTRMTREGITVDLKDLTVGTRVEVSSAEPVGNEPATATQVEVVMAGTDAAAARMRSGEEAAAAEESRQEEARAAEQARGDDRAERSDRLPSTASPLPLLGLLGASGLTAGLLLRRLRR